MAVKYVKDFIFGPMTSVQRYAKGGHVTKVPAKAKDSAKGMPARAKPNAPAKGAKRMESPPKMGKGQGYKDGGKVPGKKMDRLPTKTPPGRDKDLAPAKPFKGPNQGYAKGGKARRYAEGGDVQDPRFASIEPGAGNPMSARDQFRASLKPRMKTVQRDDMVFGVDDPYSDSEVDAMMAGQSGLNQYGEMDPYGGRPMRDILGRSGDELEPYRPIPVDELMRGEADPYAGLPEWRYLPVQTDEDRARMVLDKYAAGRGGKSIEPAFDPGAGGAPTRPYDAGTVEPLLEPTYEPPAPLIDNFRSVISPVPPERDFSESMRRNEERMRNDAAQQMRDLAEMQRRGGLYGPENPPAPTLASSYESPMASAVREAGEGRRIGMSDIMRAGRAQGMMGRGFDNEIRYDKTGMPLLPNTPVDPSMRRVPGAPVTAAMYAKGGQVKGQAKVGKVMGEYKRGELHSGSKKGPLVKNPKQAVAIALSEARKSGAKIAKKAEGGLSDKELGGKSFAGRNEPLRGRYVSREEKIMREAVAKEKQKDMERKMREAYERTQSQSVSGLKKGGMARKGVPTHKAKAMYGGGKC